MRIELANILSTEILVKSTEKLSEQSIMLLFGAQVNTATGTFDLDVDSNGRWSVRSSKV